MRAGSRTGSDGRASADGDGPDGADDDSPDGADYAVGVSSWLSVVVIAVCVVYGLVAAGYAIRDRILDDRLLLLLGVLEVLLVVQAVVGVVLGARAGRDFEAPVFYSYLLTVPFVAPCAGFLAIKDKSRWSMGVVVGSAFVVGVFIGRLNQIWTPHA